MVAKKALSDISVILTNKYVLKFVLHTFIVIYYINGYKYLLKK